MSLERTTKIGFADAVRKAVAADDDCWEAVFYQSSEWKPWARNIYMHSRKIALGPEWAEFNRCALHMSFSTDLRQYIRAGV